MNELQLGILGYDILHLRSVDSAYSCFKCKLTANVRVMRYIRPQGRQAIKEKRYVCKKCLLGLTKEAIPDMKWVYDPDWVSKQFQE